MSDDLIERLEGLKETISQARNDLAEAQGQRKEVVRQMKEEFKVDTVEAATKKLREFEKAEKSLRAHLESEVERIEEALEGMEVG